MPLDFTLLKSSEKDPYYLAGLKNQLIRMPSTDPDRPHTFREAELAKAKYDKGVLDRKNDFNYDNLFPAKKKKDEIGPAGKTKIVLFSR